MHLSCEYVETVAIAHDGRSAATVAVGARFFMFALIGKRLDGLLGLIRASELMVLID